MAESAKKKSSEKKPDKKVKKADEQFEDQNADLVIPQPDANYAVPDPQLRPLVQKNRIDWQTAGGLIIATTLIVMAMVFGGTASVFFNIPAIFIVLFGTLAVTVACFNGHDIVYAWPMIKKCFVSSGYPPHSLARALVDMSIIVRKKGTLALSSYERVWRNDKLLYPYVAMIVDGYNPPQIEMMASQELDTALDQYRKAASIMRRAAEFAPAMGLIGTLVGLVQMLGQLQDPENLGPAMALALLTTFYGAILGTMVFSPIANKIERNANREAIARQMILSAACSMAVIENPRRIEMALNAYLPPDQRLSFLTKDFN